MYSTDHLSPGDIGQVSEDGLQCLEYPFSKFFTATTVQLGLGNLKSDDSDFIDTYYVSLYVPNRISATLTAHGLILSHVLSLEKKASIFPCLSSQVPLGA
jgi:hypothetical protein